MSDGSFVEAIAAEIKQQQQLHTVEGRTYSVNPLRLIEPPAAAALNVTTLESVATYILQNTDSVTIPQSLLCVEDVDRVVLYGPLRKDNRDREIYLAARAIFPGNHFGRFTAQEEFCIWLATAFEQTDQLRELLQTVSKITAEEAVENEDNGVSQKVTVRSGIAKVEKATIKPQWVLRPYRTFPELTQPESLFLLRIKRDAAGISCALIDSGGTAWRVDTIASIGQWLHAKVDGTGMTILA